MESLISNLVDNLANVIHIIKCTYGHDNKICETYRIKYKDCGCCLQKTNVRDDLIEYNS